MNTATKPSPILDAGTTEAAWFPVQPAPFRDEQESSSDPRTFGFVRADALVQEVRDVDWLVDRYLETGSLACLFGDPGTCKTFIALDIGLSIATGRKWCGRPVTGKAQYSTYWERAEEALDAVFSGGATTIINSLMGSRSTPAPAPRNYVTRSTPGRWRQPSAPFMRKRAPAPSSSSSTRSS